MLASPRNTTLYKITGTKTFRPSSNILFKDWPAECGSNLENVEKSLRRIYLSDPGKDMLQCDQAGAEALAVAMLMPKTNKLRILFDNKIKIHNYLATIFPEQWEKEWPCVRHLATVPIPELKDDPEWPAFVKAVAASDSNPAATRYYYHYKQTSHSANYGVRANSFVENVALKSGGKVRLTKAQGEKYLEGYHSLIPEIRGFYHKYVENAYANGGILYNLQGFPITITTKYFDGEFNKIYDKIPQSTIGCITHKAWTDMQLYIESSSVDWDLLQNNYDSYLMQAPESDTDALACARMMKTLMEQELVSPVTGETFRMKSEVQRGKNWAPKSEDNPLGLEVIHI